METVFPDAVSLQGKVRELPSAILRGGGLNTEQTQREPTDSNSDMNRGSSFIYTIVYY